MIFHIIISLIYFNNLIYTHFVDYTDERFTWPGGVVPYEIDNDFDTNFVTNFLDAVIEIQEKSCVTFRPKTSEDEYFIRIKKGETCWSFVGLQRNMVDKGQTLSLNDECSSTKGTIIHYIFHAIGFFHEHTRFDRDFFITILSDNIKKDKLSFFKKRPQEAVDLLGPYDFFSIMHYDVMAYSIDPSNKRSFKINVPGINVTQIGQRKFLSPGDIHKLNTLYKCKKNNKDISDKIIKPGTPMRKLSKNVNFLKDNQCKTIEEGSCEDKLEKCPKMAQEGDCERRPGVMLKFCRKSCCNCDNRKCFDTKDSQKFNTLCISYTIINGTKRSLCNMNHTRQNAMDYCPLSCGTCTKR
uniref:Metalloendopeptidase n=1 Tax=Parastrongyloides trichosuri TaxID=131310 RepID=A0A0N4ZMM2_PARTI